MRKVKVRQVLIDILEFTFERGKLPEHVDVSEKHQISEMNAKAILKDAGVNKLCNQMVRLRSLLDGESSRLVEVLYSELKESDPRRAEQVIAADAHRVLALLAREFAPLNSGVSRR